MMLLPVLRIDDGTQCVEVINNARTLAYIARGDQPRPSGSWVINEAAWCDTHACAEFNEGDYTYPTDFDVNPAPWADPGVPASGEFFGLLLDGGSMVLEPAWSSRRRGSSVYDPQEYTPRLLTITGTIIASSARGTMFGEEWIARTLLGRGCNGRTAMFDARVMKHCPDETAAEFTGWLPYTPPANPVVQWINGSSGEFLAYGTWGPAEGGIIVLFDVVRDPVPGTDPCGDLTDAVPFTDDTEPPVLPDIGWRDLYRVRFLSLEDLDDEPMPLCDGKRVVITCEVLSEGTWWPDDERWSHWELIRRAFNADTAKSIDWMALAAEVVEPCGTCGLPCRCDPATTVIGRPPPILLPQCYRQPLIDVSVTTLTPALPWSIEAALVVEITGGTDGLENVAVTIHEALDGVPSPATVLGCRVYSAQDPCSVAQIAAVPPATTLRIDGRRGRVLLDCPGRTPAPAEHMVTGPDGHPFDHPKLSCGKRYWVTVTADYYHHSADADVSIRYVPFEVS